MAKKKTWSFEKELREAKAALAGGRELVGQVNEFREAMEDEVFGSMPGGMCSELSTTVGVTRWCEALVLSVRNSDLAWLRVHLVWRYEALRWRVTVDRAEHHVKQPKIPGKKVDVGRYPLKIFTSVWYNSMLMTMAFAATLGEDRVAHWFGDRCLKMMMDRETIATSNAWSEGSVEAYLLRLYCLWRGLDIDLAAHNVTKLGSFEPIFDSWNDDSELERAVLDICELHSWKAVNVTRPDDDLVFGLQVGANREFPAEILFLQRVRKDLGLSVPNPDHPLLRSPLMQIPFPCPRSGYDVCIDQVYSKCKEQMPYLNIPWEEEFQALGPADPRCLSIECSEVE